MQTNAGDLPPLDSDYALDPASIQAFRRDGHVLLRGVCSPEEIASYAPVIADAAARFSGESRPLAERDTQGRAFILVGGIWNRDPAMARYTLARRFARIASELMGVDAVRLYHDVAINKEAGAGYTPWHQDSYYWPMETPHTVTLWMPLLEISRRMGALNFASGSHQHGCLGEMPLSDESHRYFARLIGERGFQVVNHAAREPMAAGDATFHAGWTLHSAPDNQSDQARQAITVVYYADGARTFAEMGNRHREADFRAYMPGVQPGELAVSPLNPLVYDRTEPGRPADARRR
jgi:ectoine hydroxylase-related dioxygenase (phytanoyl-CoA dioxygenase family)